MARTVDPSLIPVVDQLLGEGASLRRITQKTGISAAALKAYAEGDPRSSMIQAKKAQAQAGVIEPVKDTRLALDARRALKDFAGFRLRYFGRYARPWMVEAANDVAQLLGTDDKEYLVVNCPPGSGKSLFFACDLPLWLICRNRAVRMLIGSSTFTKASNMTRQIQRELQRTSPLRPDEARRAQGAVDAVATLTQDFGRFKPLLADTRLWRADQFVVEQTDGTSVQDKDPTVSAAGQDTDILGWRPDFIVWDDVVTQENAYSADRREKQRRWWDDVAESRLEPRGLLVLEGQRLGPDDLYRYCIDKKTQFFTDEDLEQDRDEPTGERQQYGHIVYRAHYEDRCEGLHRTPIPERPNKRDAQPYPDGCLLDPWRLKWHNLQTAKRNTANFETVYQQEDLNPAEVLAPMLWIKGGTDSNGIVYPGCLDNDRQTCELPERLAGRLFSVATVDPSPTNYWSVQWWIVQRTPDLTQYWMMDHWRKKMAAPELLDMVDGEFTGIMDDWQLRSVELGWPINWWIVEHNAAQKFMFQYDFARRWQRARRVNVVPHMTGKNKSDPTLGVETLGPLFRHGLVRIPRKGGPAQPASNHFIDEVTRYPNGATDDCVMAFWFVRWNMPNLMPHQSATPLQPRPNWLSKVRSLR